MIIQSRFSNKYAKIGKFGNSMRMKEVTKTWSKAYKSNNLLLDSNTLGSKFEFPGFSSRDSAPTALRNNGSKWECLETEGDKLFREVEPIQSREPSA